MNHCANCGASWDESQDKCSNCGSDTIRLRVLRPLPKIVGIVRGDTSDKRT